MIKCNVNKVTSEKIYHLPIDQQYDKILIGDEQGECYAATTKEAEKQGFRRLADVINGVKFIDGVDEETFERQRNAA